MPEIPGPLQFEIPEKVRHPLVELTLARMREFLRQPEAVFWTFGFPVLLACALGIAFRNSAPERIPVGVEESGPGAAAIAAALGRSPDLNAQLLTPEEAAAALRTGKVALVVRGETEPVPRPQLAQGAGSARGKRRTGKAQTKAQTKYVYRFDPTRPESRAARLAVDDALERGLGRADVAKTSDEKVMEAGSRYIDFLIPGILGMNLMGSGLWGVGFAVVMARSHRLLKRLVATPMRRPHFLLSYMLSRLLFLVLEVGAIIGVAWLLFGVSVRGSWIALTFLSLLGALTFAGIGMLVASRARTIEGVSGLMNLVMLPMWLLSGTFFSAARFPEFAQPFIKALPLTALNDSLRAVMSDGAGLSSNWGPMAVMVAWGVASFAVASKIFRWQ